MRQAGLAGLGVAILLTVGGESLVGGAGAWPAPPATASPLDALHFRPLGPASMSGRVSDLAVYEADPAVFYVGTAHGGVWKTVNNGTTFEAQFQDMGLISIGDVTISQSNPDLVWVGTGESNNRQSTSWGDGVYKSTDGGKTWARMGLAESRHINRIVIDPRNNETVFVAATGPLFGPGGDRGVYKTTDGGRSWTHTLKVDDDTGANDLVMDPNDSRVLYASTYQRRRTACCMNGGGPGSGLWKSVDAGDTWSPLTDGLPAGPLGRIAIDVYRRRPNVLYALIEGAAQPTAAGRGRGEEGGPAGNQPDSAPTGLYRSDDAGQSWRKVNNANPRPMYFSQVRIDPNDPEVVYLGGVGLHQTTDGGRTIATDVAQPIHDDVHAIWIDPANSRHVLIGNDGGLASSYDMARTWTFYPNLPVGLFYHVGFDMATPYNVCGGMQDNYNWCGPSAVRSSAGIGNHHWTTIQGGDGFVVLQDPGDPRVIFSESQDGNMVRVDRVTGETMSIRPQPRPGEPELRWHWDTPMVHSPHDPAVLYTAANKVFRSPDKGLSWVAVSPDLTGGGDRAEIATMGVRGRDIRISRDDGIAAWPAIVSLAESPRKAGVLYAGTDDGLLQVSRDAGRTWTNVIGAVGGLPAGVFVSEVVPSRFDEATVYATFDGHRQNDFTPYVYVSRDYGGSWQALVSGLEGQIARTLTEDLKNPDVLYLGTETGLFVTLDRGTSWQRLQANLPTVRIDEITLHPRDNAMLLATHGRALWVLDNLSPIQELAAARRAAAPVLFTPAPTAMYRRPARDRNYEFWGDQTFFGENPPPAAVISWYLPEAAGAVALRVTDQAGRPVREIAGAALDRVKDAGVQSACWDLRVEPLPIPARAGRGGGQGGGGRAGGVPDSPFGAGCGSGPLGGGGLPGPWVLPGTYSVALIVNGTAVDRKPLRVAADPEVVLTEAQRKTLFAMAMEIHALQRRAVAAADAMAPLNTRLSDLHKEVTARRDVPAELKRQVEALSNEAAALVPKLAPPVGGRGGRGGGAADAPAARAAAAKNALMGGMWPTEGTLEAYAAAKTDLPKAMGEADALARRAEALRAALSPYNLTLTVPASARPVQPPNR